MASRNQNKPPPTAARSPGSTKKENLDEMQLDKRRKIGVGKPAAGLRPPSRQALVTVNSDAVTVCGSDAGSVVAGGIEFSSREDVERLLGEKMKGKNKTDFKGKCEQMLDYIKRLRVCIQWLIDREDGYVLEEKRLQEIIQAEEAKYSDMEGRMRRKEEELSTMLGELTMNHASLKEKLKKEEADKKAAIESYEKEKEARGAAERFRDALSVELSKAQKEATNAHQQIKTLQDINRRSQDYNASLQEYNSRLQNDATANNEAITKLQMEKNAMTESLSDLRAHFNSVQDQLVFLRASQQEIQKEKEDMKNILEFTRNDLQQVREDRNVQLLSVQSLTSDLEIYKQCNAKYVIELDEFMRKNSILEATCSSQKDQIEMLQDQLNTLNGNLQMADSTSMRTRIEYDEQKKLVEDLQRRLADADLKIVDGERLRKKLHNTILELKGNIRVFCRVRPLLPDHDANGHETTTAVSYPASIELQGRGIDLMHSGKKLSFTFDKVFDHGALQEDVFVEISQLVQSALDGYKVCIFAYGQTGSGKTYTMMGKQDPDLKGLIPRSLEQVFETSQSLSCQGWTYKMQASMLEIYNETIRDLLASNRPSGPEANAAAAGKQYIIKHDQNGNTHVSDLTVVDVCSIREVSYLLQQAANSRSVGRTQMNEQSSRSHFVFILRIYGDNESTDQHVQGVLNLIDLAGSERLDKSGSMGDRLKETQHINKSLLSLSEVISSIAKKEDHIPFRNSKLTYLLQPCLGGESKTLMFVNISPESSSTGESKCSLQFASKVNSCEIGIPRRQTQTRS